jgi:hypothetical protein
MEPDKRISHESPTALPLGCDDAGRGLTWYAHADLTGASGPCLTFEMRNMKPGSQATNVDTSLLGVAQDPQGNVFKITFTLASAGS